MSELKMITFDPRIWAPDREYVLVCEEEEFISPVEATPFQPLPLPNLKPQKKKSRLKWAVPLSMAIAGLWCFNRVSKENTLARDKKWGNAVSAVTGGHPEDINGM